VLWLTFQLNGRLWGIRANQVREVIPFVALEAAMAGSPPGLRGWAAYRGVQLPVVDLAILAGGVGARDRLSTRILVVAVAGRPERMAGLLVEQATDTRLASPACEPVPLEAGLPEWAEGFRCELGTIVPLVNLERLPLFGAGWVGA